MIIIKIKKMNLLAIFFSNWYDVHLGGLDYYNAKEE